MLLKDPRDTSGTGGHAVESRGTPVGPEGTAGGSGGTPRGPEGTTDNGGIGAGRKARGAQQIVINSFITVLLLKRPRNSRFASETAAKRPPGSEQTQERFKNPLELLESSAVYIHTHINTGIIVFQGECDGRCYRNGALRMSTCKIPGGSLFNHQSELLT
jgi:hypothetical protein